MIINRGSMNDQDKLQSTAGGAGGQDFRNDGGEDVRNFNDDAVADSEDNSKANAKAVGDKDVVDDDDDDFGSIIPSSSLSSTSSNLPPPEKSPIAVKYYQYTGTMLLETLLGFTEGSFEIIESMSQRSKTTSREFISTIRERIKEEQFPLSQEQRGQLLSKSQQIIDIVVAKVRNTLNISEESMSSMAMWLPTSFSTALLSSPSSVQQFFSSSSSNVSPDMLTGVPPWSQGILVGAVIVLAIQLIVHRVLRGRRTRNQQGQWGRRDSTDDTINSNSTKKNSSNRTYRRSSFSFRPKKNGALLHHSGGQLNFEAGSGKLNAEEGAFLGSRSHGLGTGGNRDRVPSSSDNIGSASLEVLGGRRGRFNTFDFFGMNQAHNQRRFHQPRGSHHNHGSGSVRGGRSASGGGEILSSTVNSTSARYRVNSSGGGRRGRGRSGSGSGPSEQKLRSNSKSYHRERLGSMDLYYGPDRGRRGTSTGAHVSDLNGTGRGRRETPVSQDSRSFVLSGEPFLNSPSAYDGDSAVFTSMAGGDDQCLYDEFGLVTLSHHVEFFGPEKLSIESATMTPPISWQVASRRIVPASLITKLHRTLKIDCSTGQLHVTEPTSGGKYDFSLPLSSISMTVHQPLEGAVISLYVKGTRKEEWMEHTFQSADAAAQFQLDMLAYQTIGETLKHTFEALNLIHLGSPAYEGQELVLHNDKRDENDDESRPLWSKHCSACVAWDDAMRALSSIPTVRIALERLWLTHRHPQSITPFRGNKKRKAKSPVSVAADTAALDTVEDRQETTLGIISEDYAGKRLLLGPVDFFRLFVPTLPETALPDNESNRGRVEQLLSWRKRAARAAVLVRAYSRAKRVVNLGWKPTLSGQHQEGQQSSLVHRLAYDGNEDNNIRDTVAKNEIYEASVSRDVLCYVRPYDFLSDGDAHHARYNFDKDLVLSPFQGYSHINTTWFKVTPDLIDEGGAMHVDRDPIDIFPSLRQLVTKNPDLDFIIYTIAYPALNILLTHVFVRSLAKGVDPQFDNVVERFRRGDGESRDRKLLVLFQLGNRMGLSLFGWMFFRLMSFVFQFTATGRDSPVILESTRDRYAFPAFKVGKMFRTKHFGGSLQEDQSKPQNYLAVSTNTGSVATKNKIFESILTRVQRHIAESIVDFTYVIEGENEDELPERALTSVRQVHINPKEVAVDPLPYIDLNVGTIPHHEGGGDINDGALPSNAVGLSSTYHSILDSFQSFTSNFTSPVGSSPCKGRDSIPLIAKNESQADSNAIEKPSFRGDPINRAVEELKRILGTIKVPTRLKPALLDKAESESIVEQFEETGTIILTLVPVLQLVDRADMESYIRKSNFDVQDATVKIVETAAWRGRTFPIDKRQCRIELQNGQFFHQGIDLDNNPVFYIRCLARGPWRSDEAALVSAMLYRFDKCLNEHAKIKPSTKITIIILMGLPKKRKKNEKIDPKVVGTDDVSSFYSKGGKDDETTDPGDSGTAASSLDDGEEIYPSSISNPRVSLQETWKMHMNESVMNRLIESLGKYYVGRLSRMIIVPGRGKSWYYLTRVEHRVKLKKILGEMSVPANTIFADKTAELCKYVDRDQLSVLVGGSAPIPDSAFEF